MLKNLRRVFSVDINLGKADSLLPGTMRAVEFQGDKYAITVYNHLGKFFATGGKCPHYGAPLATGPFVNGKVYCPWHTAAFDVQTGKKLSYPPVQDLPTYQTSINSSGELIVHLPTGTTNPSQYTDHNISVKNSQNTQKVVIVGGGAAGLACAETLRKNDYTGEIVMITKENSVPYDRVSLSKNFKAEPNQLLLRPEEFYDEFGISVLKNTSVQSIDTKGKKVHLADSVSVGYTKLLIATGSSARIFPAYQQAVGFKNVCSIRNLQDHSKIKGLLPSASKVVIIGGSFLGLEAANAIKSSSPSVDVTVIELESTPLKRIVGEKIGKTLQRNLEAKGVKFLLNKSASKVNSSGSVATSVTVDDSEIPLDVLLLSTGASMNTSFVPSELLNQDGSVRVSSFLQSDNKDIFAAGDIANFLSIFSGERLRIEHWSVAQEMGATAALNILGKLTPFSSVPFFWSNQAVNLQFVGFHGDLLHTETINENTPKEGHLSYFFKNNQTVGVAIGNWPGAAVKFKSLYESHQMPSKADLLSGLKYSDL